MEPVFFFAKAMQDRLERLTYSFEADATFSTDSIPDSWKLLLLGFIGLGVGIGIEYYSRASIPTCPP